MAEIPTDFREIFEKLLFISFFLVVIYRCRQIKAVSVSYPSCSGSSRMQTRRDICCSFVGIIVWMMCNY